MEEDFFDAVRHLGHQDGNIDINYFTPLFSFESDYVTSVLNTPDNIKRVVSLLFPLGFNDRDMFFEIFLDFRCLIKHNQATILYFANIIGHISSCMTYDEQMTLLDSIIHASSFPFFLLDRLDILISSLTISTSSIADFLIQVQSRIFYDMANGPFYDSMHHLTQNNLLSSCHILTELHTLNHTNERFFLLEAYLLGGITARYQSQNVMNEERTIALETISIYNDSDDYYDEIVVFFIMTYNCRYNNTKINDFINHLNTYKRAVKFNFIIDLLHSNLSYIIVDDESLNSITVWIQGNLSYIQDENTCIDIMKVFRYFLHLHNINKALLAESISSLVLSIPKNTTPEFLNSIFSLIEDAKYHGLDFFKIIASKISTIYGSILSINIGLRRFTDLMHSVHTRDAQIYITELILSHNQHHAAIGLKMFIHSTFESLDIATLQKHLNNDILFALAYSRTIYIDPQRHVKLLKSFDTISFLLPENIRDYLIADILYFSRNYTAIFRNTFKNTELNSFYIRIAYSIIATIDKLRQDIHSSELPDYRFLLPEYFSAAQKCNNNLHSALNEARKDSFMSKVATESFLIYGTRALFLYDNHSSSEIPLTYIKSEIHLPNIEIVDPELRMIRRYEAIKHLQLLEQQ